MPVNSLRVPNFPVFVEWLGKCLGRRFKQNDCRECPVAEFFTEKLGRDGDRFSVTTRSATYGSATYYAAYRVNRSGVPLGKDFKLPRRYAAFIKAFDALKSTSGKEVSGRRAYNAALSL